MKWLLPGLLLAAQAFAVTIPDLQATAKKLRALRDFPPESKAESLLLAEFKRQLRDWIESRIAEGVATGLNDEIERAGLACSRSACEDRWGADTRGYVGKVEVRTTDAGADWLVGRTGVGVGCGYDESAYLYENTGGKWTRRVENERTHYERGKQQYQPQRT